MRKLVRAKSRGSDHDRDVSQLATSKACPSTCLVENQHRLLMCNRGMGFSHVMSSNLCAYKPINTTNTSNLDLDCLSLSFRLSLSLSLSPMYSYTYYICIWQVLSLRVDVEGTNPLHPQRAWGAKEGQDLCASVMSETALHSPNGTRRNMKGCGW